MRFLIPALAVLFAAGCSPPPADLLASALAHAASTPHTFAGKASRSISSPGSEKRPSDSMLVSWDVKGAFAAPYASVELKGEFSTRRAIGREGWWVEPYEEVWRAYPPPYESIEWLDPAMLKANEDFGPDRVVNGVDCRSVLATHSSGLITFNISKKDGRLMRVGGGTTDGSDVYEFELTFDWSGGKVEPEDGARIALDALSGVKAGAEDPAAREAALRAWSVLPKSVAIVTTVQIDFLNASEVRRRSGYLEQNPPLRAWNLAEDKKQIFLFTDGIRTVAADDPDGETREMNGVPRPALDDISNVEILRASFSGEHDHRGVKCRLVVAEIRAKNAEKGSPTSTSWLWIAPDGRLMRQLMVGKADIAGEGRQEATTSVDVTIRPDPGVEKMTLLKRAAAIFRR